MADEMFTQDEIDLYDDVTGSASKNIDEDVDMEAGDASGAKGGFFDGSGGGDDFGGGDGVFGGGDGGGGE